ncbi:ATP-binding cassette domain-containing protein [Enterococcus sp. BWR-S5]|uniref:ATP-binding cassette domain-containing protein n=1 Tax=Enterococcus sp. BWR-S5 TaxID=2787714 RepID=UPI001924A46B|nr:ABC transporter ATP-binding protein [Enterococcus sp. BWR-S5]MBL1226381.1 ABC transporter ATP-binding protein [Enterococcus sp. BWR-S5]
MSLVIKDVSKKYKEKAAISDITLTFEPQKIYGLLGRNGAGKSTLLNIIANRNFSTSGTICLDNQPITDQEPQLNRIYLMSEDNLFPGNMKVHTIFKVTETFYGTFDWQLAEQMIIDFDVNQALSFRKLSTGYRSIVKLITALCVPCDYIFLDEPVLGLDATHRDLFYEYLLDSYGARSRTFIISTHLIEEIANIIEEVVFIDDGKVIQNDSTENILAQIRVIKGPQEIFTSFSDDLEILANQSFGGSMTAYVKWPFDVALPSEITVEKVSLQEYFIQLTKRKRGSI